MTDTVEAGTTVRTDDWAGYRGLADQGCDHRPVPMRVSPATGEAVLSRVHLVFSLLKRWRLIPHQGAVRHSHLDYYLDEFTFRFNRRKSASWGKLFYRLLPHAVEIAPHPYQTLRGGKTAEPQQAVAT